MADDAGAKADGGAINLVVKDQASTEIAFKVGLDALRPSGPPPQRGHANQAVHAHQASLSAAWLHAAGLMQLFRLMLAHYPRWSSQIKARAA